MEDSVSSRTDLVAAVFALRRFLAADTVVARSGYAALGASLHAAVTGFEHILQDRKSVV